MGLLHMYDLTQVTLTRTGSDGSAPVLRSLDLHVGRGEAVAISGPEGVGKSALLRVLAGVERPHTGTVRLHEENLAAMTPKRLAQVRSRDIGWVCAPPKLVGWLSVQDNVELALARLGVASEDRREAVTSSLEAVGLEPLRDVLVADLDAGTRQRVAVARGLAAGASVLLVEEPTRETMSLLVNLWQLLGLTLVVTTRDESVAARAQRRVVLAGGSVHERPRRAAS